MLLPFVRDAIMPCCYQSIIVSRWPHSRRGRLED